ncbi:MAG: hypothetical protein C0467_29690 [Planctomycetaceae bacterium]|nr:hypothetical protein [Planctomycetaceae bacterium]
MTPEVTAAVAEVRMTFDGRVEVEEEAQGGAYVTVFDLPIGPRFKPAVSWVGFLVTFQHPRADVYPHFLDAAVAPADSGALPAGISAGHTWRGKTALQVSRKSHRWNPAADTAVTKLAKVLTWLRSQ